MVEWSPSLESVTIPDPTEPSRSLWVMRVPRALRAASRTVGYPSPNITWEAVLDAPGPPLMRWSSLIESDGTQQNAGVRVPMQLSPPLRARLCPLSHHASSRAHFASSSRLVASSLRRRRSQGAAS
jgi:hypothetical protein